MTGVQQPELPPGCDFDYINAEVIETKLRVQDGLLTLPNGAAYRVLVLPEMTTMRPALLEKILILLSPVRPSSARPRALAQSAGVSAV